MLIEDLSLFFNTNEFATTALYNGATTIKGLLGKSYVAINEVESTAPSFTCALSDIPNAKQNDTLLINGITYAVVNVKPDATGLITLILEEQ